MDQVRRSQGMGSGHQGQEHSLPHARDRIDQGKRSACNRHPNEKRDEPCDCGDAVWVDAQDRSVRRGDSRPVRGVDYLERGTPEDLASRCRARRRCLNLRAVSGLISRISSLYAFKYTRIPQLMVKGVSLSAALSVRNQVRSTSRGATNKPLEFQVMNRARKWVNSRQPKRAGHLRRGAPARDCSGAPVASIPGSRMALRAKVTKICPDECDFTFVRMLCA